jgi:CRISPR-associated endonuclease/helicase Cas3
MIGNPIYLFVIDEDDIDKVDVGLGNRINTVMQTAFFKISGVLAEDEAIKLMKAAVEKQFSNTFNNPIYYLSTNIIPADRLRIIDDIKRDLKNRKSPILISTQVIEAGVDVDFDMGWRGLAPIESIVQVAGRINRENSIERRYSPLYVIDLGDSNKIYGTISETQSRKALDKEEIIEPDYFQLVEEYFWNLSSKNSYKESRKLFEGMKRLRYDGHITEDYIPVSHFNIIKGGLNTVSVFIELNITAEKAKIAFLKRFQAKSRKEKYELKENFDRYFKKDFYQYVVNIPSYLTEELPLLDDNYENLNIKYVSMDKIKDWYSSSIGFNRERVINMKEETNKTVIL